MTPYWDRIIDLGGVPAARRAAAAFLRAEAGWDESAIAAFLATGGGVVVMRKKDEWTEIEPGPRGGRRWQNARTGKIARRNPHKGGSAGAEKKGDDPAPGEGGAVADKTGSEAAEAAEAAEVTATPAAVPSATPGSESPAAVEQAQTAAAQVTQTAQTAILPQKPAPEKASPEEQKDNRSRLWRQLGVFTHKVGKRWDQFMEGVNSIGRTYKKGVEIGYHGFREWVAARLENVGVARETTRPWVDTVASISDWCFSLVGLGTGGSFVWRTAQQVVADRKRAQQKKAGEDVKSIEAEDARHEAIATDKALGWSGLVDTLWTVATISAGVAGFGWWGGLVGAMVGVNAPIGSATYMGMQLVKNPARAIGAALKVLTGRGESKEFNPKHIPNVQREAKKKKRDREVAATEARRKAADSGAGPAAMSAAMSGAAPAGTLNRGKLAAVLRDRAGRGWDLDWWTVLLAAAFDLADRNFHKAVAAADQGYQACPEMPAGSADDEDAASEFFRAQMEPLLGRPVRKGGRKAAA